MHPDHGREMSDRWRKGEVRQRGGGQTIRRLPLGVTGLDSSTYREIPAATLYVVTFMKLRYAVLHVDVNPPNVDILIEGKRRTLMEYKYLGVGKEETTTTHFGTYPTIQYILTNH